MIPINKLKPFTRFCVTLGMIPSSYKESLTYEEQLLWFCDFLENKVIPAVNNNAEAVTELQNLYEEFKTYVENYLANLDVQEEINNKLDEMVEDGTLQEIITEYVNIKGVLAFNTVADMKNATNLINGSFVETYGFYSLNDGGNANYKIREITNQDVVDNILIIPLQNENLIAELINPKNIKQFGAKGDEINDDTLSIQTALNYGGKIEVPKGNYLISDTLILSAGSYLRGESANKSKIILKNGSNCDMVHITNGRNAGIENITLFGNWYNENFNPNGTNTEGNGIVINTELNQSSTGLMFTNLRLEYIPETAIVINQRSWIQNWFNVSIFRTGKYGIEDYSSDNNFYGLNIFGCEEAGIYAKSANTHYIGGKIYVNSGRSKKASVIFDRCYRNTITGMEIQESYGDCFQITGGEYNTLENVVLDGPGYYNKEIYGNHIGLVIENTSRFSFIGGMITNGAGDGHLQDKGIYIDSNSNSINIDTLLDNARFTTPIENNCTSTMELKINGWKYNNYVECEMPNYSTQSLVLNQDNILKPVRITNSDKVISNAELENDGSIFIKQPGDYLIDYYVQVSSSNVSLPLLAKIKNVNSNKEKKLFFENVIGNYRALHGTTVIHCPYGNNKFQLLVAPRENLDTGTGDNHLLTITRL